MPVGVPVETKRRWAKACCCCPCLLCCEVVCCNMCQLARIYGVVEGTGGTPKMMDNPEWGTCCGICLIAVCAPSCGASAIAKYAFNVPTAFKGHAAGHIIASSAGNAVSYILLGLCSAYLRLRSVEKLNVEESALTSFCFGFWCIPCSLAQINMQFSLDGLFPGGCCCYTSVDPSVYSSPQPGYARVHAPAGQSGAC